MWLEYRWWGRDFQSYCVLSWLALGLSLLAGMVLAVHLPVLHLKGPHYLYWPAAFWSLLSAALLGEAWRQWRALGPQLRPR